MPAPHSTTAAAPIRQDDFIQSIFDAFQFISYYHPLDYIQALGHAYEREEGPAAKDAIAQILTNSRLCAEGKRPICQDTGIAVVFLKIGMHAQWDATLSIQEMVDEGVRRAYLHPDNKLRASVLLDPAGKRINSKDNTPAVIHTEMVAGDQVEVICAAKGGGSENKAKMAMLNPSDSIVDWVLKTVPTMGAGWCPPGILGIGIGGTPEKAMLLAKEALMAPVDIQDLIKRGASNRVEELRLELYDKVNALGIGAQGLGGLATVLDVKIYDCPTHAASKPVDELSVSEALTQRNMIDGAGGKHYVSELAAKVPAAGNAKHYAEIVQQNSLLRRLLGAGQEIQGWVNDRDGEPRELSERAEKLLFEVAHEWLSSAREAVDPGRNLQRWVRRGLDYILLVTKPGITRHLTAEEYDALEVQVRNG